MTCIIQGAWRWTTIHASNGLRPSGKDAYWGDIYGEDKSGSY
jgi:hypothetical protein